MQALKFGLSLAITLALIWLGSTNQPFGSTLPPLGKILNPSTGVWQNAEPTDGPRPEQLQLEGLKEAVQVVFDERLVPHIFASNLHDAYMAQGYVTARYRLWQMDISTRAAGGFLSEVLGERTVEYDRRQRRKGMLWAARNALEGWRRSPEEWAMLEAYTAGVNAYVDQLSPAEYPLEFKLMDYRPQPWSPLKTALFFKNMAETLCSRSDDIPASNTRNLLGQEFFDFLFPEINPHQSPVIPAGKEWAFDTVSIPEPADQVLIGKLWPAQPFPQPDPFLGSNNWAVAGAKTASGNPILCNDPHLFLSVPSIWFELQLHTPELNAYGVSLPGVPGITIGFNEDVAWGMTNVGQDVLDWYAITWLDEQKKQYLLDDQPQEVKMVYDTIRVRGRSTPLVEPVKYTVWGPVVYEEEGHPYQDLAMRWIAHDVPTEKPFYDLGVFQRLMAAKNYDDYDQALKSFESPAQNFVFASREGDIALKVNGRFPLKRKGQGRFVQDGSLSDNAWHGFIPMDQIPKIKNPARGFVASANQHSTDPSYPYYYNGGFDDYRGRLINRQLAEKDDFTVEDMKRLQNENYSLFAEEAVPALLAFSGEISGADPDLLGTIRSWDYRYRAGDYAPVLVEEWFDAAYRMTFDELLAARDSVTVMMPESWRFIDLLKEVPDHPVFDQPSTPERETAATIVARAFTEVQQKIKDGELTKQNWASYKATRITHRGIGAFSSPELLIGGYRNAPNAITSTNGPSWRMIVELGPELHALGVYPGGQSGNPGSPFYDNAIDTWARGDYYELFFMNDPADERQPVLFTLQME